MVGVYATVLVSLVFAGLRFILPSQGLNRKAVFKDLAHLWVGGLFGAAAASGEGWLWRAALFLTFVEVVAFFIKKPTR